MEDSKGRTHEGPPLKKRKEEKRREREKRREEKRREEKRREEKNLNESHIGDVVNRHDNAHDHKPGHSRDHQQSFPIKSLSFGPGDLEALSYHRDNQGPIRSERDGDKDQDRRKGIEKDCLGRVNML